MIEADPDCEHPEFDLAGHCVLCGRDFSEQRAAGERSAIEMEAEPTYESEMAPEDCGNFLMDLG